MNNFYVYFLRRPDRDDPLNPGQGQPFYVGKGSNGRVNEHRKEAKALLHKSGRKSIKVTIIHKLWKQGLDFKEDIIHNNLIEQEAFVYEIQMIAIYGRVNNKTGCLANLTDGGEGQHGAIRSNEMKQKLREAHIGKTHTDETKKEMSESRKGKGVGTDNPMYGRKHTKEFIEKLRQINIGKNNKMYGKKRPDVSEMNRNRINPNLGKPMTEEQKLKISEAHKGLRHTEETKQRLRNRIVTRETKDKLRSAKVGFIPWNKGLKKNDLICNNSII